ncbi:hypothetical protein DPMN_092386 [Dreissena polymorpha]|uniref:Uncharacterized protein n=1 Tax=Dreissena polymorpha TaxID=45954 RepID=A0A9D4L1M2_DREPO|nr:hypothetical protein DPMN_092386 [Dreissena polymorpha]
MIFTGTSRKPYVLTQQFHSVSSGKHVPVKCQCAHEVALLKDTVKSLQARMLLLKQSILVNENLRKQQINQLMSRNLAIKADILKCSSNVNSVTSSTLQTLFNISIQAMSRVTECEDSIGHVEVYLENRNIMSPPSPNHVLDPLPNLTSHSQGLIRTFHSSHHICQGVKGPPL